jgi:RimJ/RimL family protein N-acetyltransferase
MTGLALPLRTGRLSLRALRAADSAGLQRMAVPRLRADAQVLLIEDRTTGCALGVCGLQPLAHGDETEFFCAVVEAQRGRRVASEAGSILLERAFRDLGLARVVAVVDAENEARVRVLEKLGLRAEGAYWDGGARRDLSYFARGAALPTPRLRYRLRRASAEECDALAALEEAADVRFAGTAVGTPELFAGPPVSPETLRAARAAQALWIAADVKDAPVGFALFERSADGVHLEELDVLPEHGQRGLGSRLLQAVLAQAFEEGAARVTLNTFRAVAWNAPFYARRGFVELAEADWPPAVAERVASEAARGMRPADRVVMERVLRAPGR